MPDILTPNFEQLLETNQILPLRLRQKFPFCTVPRTHFSCEDGHIDRKCVSVTIKAEKNIRSTSLFCIKKEKRRLTDEIDVWLANMSPDTLCGV